MAEMSFFIGKKKKKKCGKKSKCCGKLQTQTRNPTVNVNVHLGAISRSQGPGRMKVNAEEKQEKPRAGRKK